jgi:hypothetical protein
MVSLFLMSRQESKPIGWVVEIESINSQLDFKLKEIKPR